MSLGRRDHSHICTWYLIIHAVGFLEMIEADSHQWERQPRRVAQDLAVGLSF